MEQHAFHGPQFTYISVTFMFTSNMHFQVRHVCIFMAPFRRISDRASVKADVLFSTEEQNKRTTYSITHMGWGLGPSMQGVMVMGLEGFSCCLQCDLTFLPTLPPSHIRRH